VKEKYTERQQRMYEEQIKKIKERRMKMEV
jgi:hypothetical protein